MPNLQDLGPYVFSFCMTVVTTLIGNNERRNLRLGFALLCASVLGLGLQEPEYQNCQTGNSYYTISYCQRLILPSLPASNNAASSASISASRPAYLPAVLSR